MNPSTILHPSSAPPEEPGVTRAPLSASRARIERARRNRRILAVGLIASAVVHFLAVILSPLVVRYATPGTVTTRPLEEVVPPGKGIRVVDLIITETPPERPPREEQPERREPQPEPTVADEGDAGAPLTVAERLRPRVGDWRLWVLPPITDREPTPAEREAYLNARLQARVAALNDSIAAAEARRAAQNYWTVGEEGNNWGFSPGNIHLGPVTLPFPFAIGPSREDAAATAEWEAIQRQAGQAGVDEVFDDRVKAIRERRERERAREEAARDTTSGG